MPLLVDNETKKAHPTFFEVPYSPALHGPIKYDFGKGLGAVDVNLHGQAYQPIALGYYVELLAPGVASEADDEYVNDLPLFILFDPNNDEEVAQFQHELARIKPTDVSGDIEDRDRWIVYSPEQNQSNFPAGVEVGRIYQKLLDRNPYLLEKQIVLTENQVILAMMCKTAKVVPIFEDLPECYPNTAKKWCSFRVQSL